VLPQLGEGSPIAGMDSQQTNIQGGSDVTLPYVPLQKKLRIPKLNLKAQESGFFGMTESSHIYLHIPIFVYCIISLLS
jgi:hypothetical protein